MSLFRVLYYLLSLMVLHPLFQENGVLKEKNQIYNREEGDWQGSKFTSTFSTACSPGFFVISGVSPFTIPPLC